jgi:hypothetical protein
MKWLCLAAALFFYATFEAAEEPARDGSKTHPRFLSIESKIRSLEQQVGIKPPTYKTTFNLFGDFLYWKASLDGVGYATTAVGVVNADGSDGFNKFKTRTVHFSYDPGFLIGAGVGLPYDQWDVGCQWLRFHTRGKDKAHGSLDAASGHRAILDLIGMLEPLLSPPGKATADCRIHLDVVDLVMGRSFYWSRYFNFRPFAGLRAAWVDIDWDISFTRPIFPGFPDPQTFAFLDAGNDFNAIGFLGGFESDWTFHKGLGLFSYATASLIYGKSSEHTREEFFLVPASGTKAIEQTLKAQNATHTVKSVFDLALGIQWSLRFKKDRYGLLLRAGYDFFYWPNVTQKTVIQNNRIRDRADLSFQGLIMGAKFEF